MIYSINEVGNFCKFFRKNILNMTLKEFSEKTEIKVSTISAFENGRSNNLEHLNNYLKLSNPEQEQFFRNNIPYKVGE